VFYSVTSIRAGDWLSLAGSILFFLVCIVFVPVPMWDRDTDGSGADGDYPDSSMPDPVTPCCPSRAMTNCAPIDPNALWIGGVHRPHDSGRVGICWS
jgi:hypothetical protein